MGHGNESVFGQLPHHVEVRPHVHLAAHQHHFGTGTELLRLPLPLCGKSMRSFITCLLEHTSSSEITSLQISASPSMVSRVTKYLCQGVGNGRKRFHLGFQFPRWKHFLPGRTQTQLESSLQELHLNMLAFKNWQTLTIVWVFLSVANLLACYQRHQSASVFHTNLTAGSADYFSVNIEHAHSEGVSA